MTNNNTKTKQAHFAKVELIIALESDQSIEDIKNNFNEDFIEARVQLSNHNDIWLDTDVLAVNEVEWSENE